jgi:hypothetical protein
MDSSPRNPSSTIRIFSSAPYCLRVARRMSLTTCSAGAFCVPAFCLIGTDAEQLYRLYAIAKRDGIDYNFIDVPFDNEFMRALYEKATKWAATAYCGKRRHPDC